MSGALGLEVRDTASGHGGDDIGTREGEERGWKQTSWVWGEGRGKVGNLCDLEREEYFCVDRGD